MQHPMPITLRSLIYNIGIMLIAALLCVSLTLPGTAQNKDCNLDEPPGRQLACLLDGNSMPAVRSLLERESNDATYFDQFRLSAPAKLWRAGVTLVDDRKSVHATYFVIHTFTVRASGKVAVDEIHSSRTQYAFDSSFNARINVNGKGNANFDENRLRNAAVLTENSGMAPAWQIASSKGIHIGLEEPRPLGSSPERITFTKEQVKALAALYLYASIRSNNWLIPVFHNKVEVAFQNTSPDSAFWLSLDSAINEVVRKEESEVEGIKFFQAYEDYLEKSLRVFGKNFDQSISTLKMTTKSLPNGQLIEGYDSAKVIKLVRDSKAELIQRLAPDEYAGLRAYVRKYYPSIDAIALGPNEGRRRTSFLNVVYGGGISIQLGLVVPEALNQLAQQVHSLTAKLRENKTAIDLQIQSQPAGATFQLSAEGGARATRDTNSTITNFHRGYYNYTVTLDGFTTISHPINLVDDRATKVVCTLEKTRVGPCVWQ